MTTTIRITARIYKSTHKAVLVYQSQPAQAVWLARSQITILETGQRTNGHDIVEITLPQWLAKENNLANTPPPGASLFADMRSDITPSPQGAEDKKGGALAREAAMLCQEGAFAVFLGVDSASVVAELKRRCNIQSRAELDHKPMAAAAFKNLKSDYQLWMHT